MSDFAVRCDVALEASWVPEAGLPCLVAYGLWEWRPGKTTGRGYLSNPNDPASVFWGVLLDFETDRLPGELFLRPNYIELCPES